MIRVCDLFRYVQQKFAGEPIPQQPVFKAELEEDYPIARYRDARAEIPAAPDALQYDAFISYRNDDYDDRDWVEEVMVPRLERLGLRVCIETRDFQLGAPLIEEAELAVEQSRYTVAVFTPAYVAGPFAQYQRVLAAHLGMGVGRAAADPAAAARLRAVAVGAHGGAPRRAAGQRGGRAAAQAGEAAAVGAAAAAERAGAAGGAAAAAGGRGGGGGGGGRGGGRGRTGDVGRDCPGIGRSFRRRLIGYENRQRACRERVPRFD